jgi:hypothetical protein
LRRLYLYLVSAAALTLLATGLALLGSTVLLFIFHDPSGDSNRTQAATFAAMTLVALPVWAVHFWFAARFARRDPQERASVLRRLYVYWACFASAVGAAEALSLTINFALGPVDGVRFDALAASQAAWVTLVLLTVFVFHFRIASRDRKAVEESGASATLRRWYMYLALGIGTLMLLSGTSHLIQGAWWRLATVSTSSYNSVHLSWESGQMIAGLLLWGFHARVISLRHLSEDRHSTLRTLEGFVIVGVSIVVAVVGASLILYYGLARAIGVANPGGVSGEEVLSTLGGPGSQLLVYGVAWILMRRRLARDAVSQESSWQAGVRRLYTNLAALVSLAAAASGAGILLWTLAEQVEAPLIGVSPGEWKDFVSFGSTLLVVGALIWIAYWRHAPWADDRQSLSRRLYVWAALLASVLVLLGAGVGIVNAVLQQLFSAHPSLATHSNLDFGHYFGVIVVAAVVAVYHGRVLRADAAARPPKIAPVAAPVVVTPVAKPEPEVVDSHARHYALVVTDATEDDIHQALADLPPQASYKLTATEPVAVDGS